MEVIKFMYSTNIFTLSMSSTVGLLARRIIWGTETLAGDASAGISQMIKNHFLSPSNTSRKITGFSFSAPNFGIPINTQISYSNLLDAVEGLCNTGDIGIKTMWNPETRQFSITLYMGASSQAVFSQEFENLTEQMYSQSLLSYANTALVGGEGEGAARQFVTVGGSSGLDRYEMFVDAKDLQSSEIPNYTAALTQRGQSKLAEFPVVNSFDAAVNPHGNLKYKTDFDLGQIVRVISKKWGVALTARITEIEESYDRNGWSLQVVFGRGLLTLAQKIKGGM